MKTTSALLRSLSLRGGRDIGSQGFLMPTTLVVVLTMLTGLAVELSSLSNMLRASVTNSANRKAEEAANYGLNDFIDKLNTDQNSYLLATRLQATSSTGDWQTVTAANLSNCSLKPPSTPPAANRIAGVSTNTVQPNQALPGHPDASYSLVGFEPATSSKATAAGCGMFGNLAGGQARITVRGIVSSSGKELARYDLVRLVNVQPVIKPPSQPNQLGLMLTGSPSWSELGGPSFLLYDLNGNGLADYTGEDAGANVNCTDCSSSATPDVSKSTLGSLLPGAVAGLSGFPTMPTELTGAPERDLTTSPGSTYPYATTSTAPGSLLSSECRWLTVNGVTNAEIGCRIGEVTINGGTMVTVRADLRPVRLYVSGDFKTTGNGALSVTDGDSTTPASNDVRSFWKNLRVYGRDGTPASQSDCNQSVTFSGSSNPYGFALWFPLGNVTISGGGKKAQPDFYGSLWTCKIDKISGNSTVLVPQDVVPSLAPQLNGGVSFRVRGVRG
jgi:hypothetical protein